MVTKKKVNDMETYYTSVSEVQYTLFKKMELVYFYEALFKNKKLDKSYFIYKKNGAVEEESKYFWTPKGYKSSIPEKSLKQKTLLEKSMLHTYFHMPVHREEIFSERFHDFVRVGATEEKGKFIFYIPNGDKSIYYYNDIGICRMVSINAGIISFDMVLTESRN